MMVQRSPPVIKLIDFGMARSLETGKAQTYVGTPEYIAPEVIAVGEGDAAFYTQVPRP